MVIAVGSSGVVLDDDCVKIDKILFFSNQIVIWYVNKKYCVCCSVTDSDETTECHGVLDGRERGRERWWGMVR